MSNVNCYFVPAFKNYYLTKSNKSKSFLYSNFFKPLSTERHDVKLTASNVTIFPTSLLNQHKKNTNLCIINTNLFINFWASKTPNHHNPYFIISIITHVPAKFTPRNTEPGWLIKAPKTVSNESTLRLLQDRSSSIKELFHRPSIAEAR